MKLVFFCLLALACPAFSSTPEPAAYRTEKIEGWTVHTSERLLAESPEAIAHALEMLKGQLAEIVRVVPSPAVAKLREVPLWFSPEYPGIIPRAEYHPNPKWLVEHGRNVAMAKGVEFTNVRIYDAEIRRMPVFVLHELAHAYHDRVLRFDQPEVKAAYQHAVASKTYEAVERRNGDRVVGTHERAYALSNEREYFAETTEAFFGRNDFYPFTRDELRAADPEMERLLARLWGAEQ